MHQSLHSYYCITGFEEGKLPCKGAWAWHRDHPNRRSRWWAGPATVPRGSWVDVWLNQKTYTWVSYREQGISPSPILARKNKQSTYPPTSVISHTVRDTNTLEHAQTHMHKHRVTQIQRVLRKYTTNTQYPLESCFDLLNATMRGYQKSNLIKQKCSSRLNRRMQSRERYG